MIVLLDRHRSAVLALAAALAASGGVGAASKPAPRPVDETGRALYRTVRLVDASRDDLRELTILGFDLEGRSDGHMVAHATEEEIRKLEALGISWQEVPGGPPLDEAATATYHTYATMTAELQQVAADHPEITRLVSAGQSVQGRELWWLLITDDPDVEEDEPGFKYVATMHGDEKVGTENCLRLVRELTDGYGTDSRLTRLVDEVEIWIMPLMNPDGHTLGQRYNAAGFDLNRNFPDRIDDPVNSTDGRQPETAAVMDWQSGHSTSLSANFHGGALVVNYPYDNNETKQNVYTATPDDDIVRDLSIEYSEDNDPMYNGNWPQGVTNGADWYVISGGMQDWNYAYEGDIDTTIELSNFKTPPASQLEQYWLDNRESMISYLERVLTGVRGRVTDRDTGEPLAARLEVSGRGAGFFTDPEVGDYHRPMPAGSFELVVTSEGYGAETVPFSVTDPEADAVRADVTLRVLATALEHVAHRVDQDGGDDGYLDPGESGHVAVTLENLGEQASGITGELIALTAHATATGPAAWPSLGPGDEAESEPPHLALDVSPAAPPGHKLGLAVDWRTNEGAAGTSSAFFVPLGAPAERRDDAAGLPLPVGDHTTVESTITVSEDEELSEVNVRVDITHTFIGDLRVTLVAPDGTEVRLHDRGGGSTDDIHTWYDTETEPAESLEVLAGRSSQGTWTLRVEDLSSGDEGSLDGWTLERLSRVWEDPVAEVRLRAVDRTGADGARVEWWPVGSATSYRVYRSTDPSSEESFADVTGEDPDPTDTSFEDASSGAPLLFWIVSAEGHTGEGLWGHFGR